jgi:hypothetical protein
MVIRRDFTENAKPELRAAPRIANGLMLSIREKRSQYLPQKEEGQARESIFDVASSPRSCNRCSQEETRAAD